MTRTKKPKPIRGEGTQGDTPDWKPLEHLIGEEMIGWFMWMYEVELADGTRLDVYKHRMTRRSIWLQSVCGFTTSSSSIH